MWERNRLLIWILGLAVLPVAGSGETRGDTEQRGAVRVAMPDGTPIVEYEGSHALLVGVSRYENGWDPIESIPRELRMVRDVLEEHRFEVRMVLDPNEAEMRSAIEAFVDDYGFQEGNRLLVYFAGHGYRLDFEDGARGYIVPADAPRPSIDEEEFLRRAIDFNEIVALMRKIISRHVLFVFDSCYSGVVLSARGESPPAFVTASLGKPARQLLTAGRAGEVVPSRSTFVHELANGLQGAADMNLDRYITVGELATFLKVHASRPGLTPQFGRLPGYSEGEMIFRTEIPPPPRVRLDVTQFVLEKLSIFSLRPLRQIEWLDFQQQMSKAFEVVEWLAAGGEPRSVKDQAWRLFLKAFESDNPFSSKDDELRRVARERLLRSDEFDVAACGEVGWRFGGASDPRCDSE